MTARDVLRDAVVILLAVALLAWLSALADPEPGLPRCPAGRPAHERCSP